ncbi:hypothetical protein KUL25_20880 [Rhodobacteraceae bacterium N5(2021)]|uniref:Uncharacterized protein n=1 Tax=Gymnodinialimonas phycosphaerae TaxID=2841589 RepID=A0A975TUS3_9RHOB|nr:hypothetical protein [Gymnodinialimonas phycosphaerae]MBY4895225.1 hypothetical protein [Gymnodinialimonas phycosphaerae]
MTLRNRVLPTGDITADPARGTLTGNRGILVAPDGRMMNRQWAGKAWITCVLEFRGRKRPVAQPHTWTELFFLDEAVALSAGHRPCAYCRRADYTAYRDRFPRATKAPQMDTVLHAERLNGRKKRLHAVHMDDLPDGAFIDHSAAPHLVWGDSLLRYGPGGYGPAIPRPTGPTQALTPPATLAVLSKGYRPMLHPSASVPLTAP